MIFLLVILKIPIVYLGAVIWWAIKAEPKPEAPAALVAVGSPLGGGPTWQRSSRLRARTGRGPVRRPPGRRAAVKARARR